MADLQNWYVTDCCMAPIQNGRCLKCGNEAAFRQLQFKKTESHMRPLLTNFDISMMALASGVITFAFLLMLYIMTEAIMR
jgi:hypothetical protein